MRYQALAMDLDGTLTNSEKRVSARNIKAILQAAKNGVHIILASGRCIRGVEPVAREIGMDKFGGYFLACNGSALIEYPSGQILYEQSIKTEVYGDICQICKQFHVSLIAYDALGIFSEDNCSEYVLAEQRNNGIPLEHPENLCDLLGRLPRHKMLGVGEPEALDAAREELRHRLGNRVNVYYADPHFLEIMPPKAEKAFTLDILMQRLNVPSQALVACGDGLNDILMLDYAGLSAAPANAFDETKRHADVIVNSNDDDAIADLIEQYILNK